MNARVKEGKVYFNGIPGNHVYPAVTKDGSAMVNSKGDACSKVSLEVPNEFSRNGFVSVTTAYVNDDKFNEGQKSISMKEGTELTLSVCTFSDKNDKSNNKYKEVKITAEELAAKVNERAKEKAEKTAETTEEAVEEAEGPELD